MSYFVFCTFDLKNGTASDYKNAYADLERLGLKRVIVSSQNTNVVIPTTSAAGTVEGDSASAVRDAMCDKIQQAFKARQFSSEIFVVVCGDWAWGGRTT